VTIGSREFELTPPDREGLLLFEEWLRNNRRSPLEVAKANLEGLTKEQQAALLSAALSQESKIAGAISTEEYGQALDTREGSAMMFWIMARRNHPELKREEVLDLVVQASEEEFAKLISMRDGMLEADEGV